jgi:glutaminyl-tRNA synthetase
VVLVITKITFKISQINLGVVITRDDVKKAASAFIDSKKADLTRDRYLFPVGSLYAGLKDNLKWADAKDIKDEIDAHILALLGPKTKEDEEKAKIKKKPTAVPANSNNNAAAAPEKENLVTFPDPHDNKQKKPSILEAHLKATNAKVICRFPPEPNGYLHLGHAKSMNLNFSYPLKSGGYTIFRFDDTNPEAEKDEYFTSIIEVIISNALGFIFRMCIGWDIDHMQLHIRVTISRICTNMQ